MKNPKCISAQKEADEILHKFSSFIPRPDLPPLLEFCNGKAVTSPKDWEKRKKEIRQLLCHYFLGAFPGEIPSLKEARVLSENSERETTIRLVKLTFDTTPKASFVMEVMIPQGKGPFPVFLTQTNHRRWALLGLSRGYLACVYPGADIDDQTECFKKAYPECDWALIPRRAWLGSRALDYILTLEEADKKKVAITGHSRNGKQSLIAAAFDERITAVISSSSGSPGSCPYRFTSEFTFTESPAFFPELSTVIASGSSKAIDPWFHPRLRSFVGREHELPIDAHGLIGLIAPRQCLLSTACNDGCDPTFAVERAYLAAREVYRFLKCPKALRTRWRYGAHETTAQDIQAYFDWYDFAFGRGNENFQEEFPEILLHHFDWAQWKSRFAKESKKVPLTSPQSCDRETNQEQILWMLGEAPPAGISYGGSYGAEKASQSALMTRDRWDPGDITRTPINFGEYVSGNLYYQSGARGPMPVVIWLHPYSYPSGYNEGYGVQNTTIYHHLAQEGFLVLAYDQVGFGLRLLEGKDFYKRYPQWSRLGKMVRDVHAAVDFLFCNNQSKNPISMPSIDPEQICCLGYSLGAVVALYATAMEKRITSVASFCGFTPMRTDTDKKSTGGIRRYWEWHALLPRLGLFHNRESEIPYDYEDVLELIAPRPCLVVAPSRDREADMNDVIRCVEKAKESWEAKNAQGNLTFLTPNDYNRFQWPQHEIFLGWIKNL